MRTISTIALVLIAILGLGVTILGLAQNDLSGRIALLEAESVATVSTQNELITRGNELVDVVVQFDKDVRGLRERFGDARPADSQADVVLYASVLRDYFKISQQVDFGSLDSDAATLMIEEMVAFDDELSVFWEGVSHGVVGLGFFEAALWERLYGAMVVAWGTSFTPGIDGGGGFEGVSHPY